MQHRYFLQWCAGICLALMSLLARADYANVNDIKQYYQVTGSGTPVVLLHGGYDDADMWNIHTWLLAFHYKVIVLDSRGHGRSERGNLPLTYEQMANDTLTLLDQLNIPNAHFVGWSDGAVIASQIAAQHPERVNKLMLFGAAYQADSYVDAFALLLSTPELFLPFIDSLYKKRYLTLNPHPELWSQFQADLYSLWLSPCYFADQPYSTCLNGLQSINAPTMVVAGDLEIIKRAHTQAIAASIPQAQLKIVPLASHYLPKLRPFLTTDIIAKFLQ